MNISTKNLPSEKITIGTGNGEEWTFLEICFTLVLGGIAIATIAGNALILYLFWKSKRSLRSPTHCLIANLAIADLAVGIGVMPTLISVTVSNFKWYFGTNACICNEYFHFLLCAASLLSMTGIAIERYIGIKFPLRHKRILTRKRVLGIILLIWCLALLLTAGPLTMWPLKRERTPAQAMYCPVNLRSDFILFISVSLYWIPVLVTGFSYWRIYRRAVQLYVPSHGERNMTGVNYDVSMVSSNSVNSRSTFCTTTSTKSKPNIRDRKSGAERLQETRKKQTKLAKKLSYIVVIMLVLYAPLFTVFFIVGFYHSFITPYLLLTVGWLRYFCSCTNPYLYIAVVPGFKKSFFKTFWNEKRKNAGESKDQINTETVSTTKSSGNDTVSKLVHNNLKTNLTINDGKAATGPMQNVSPIDQESLVFEIRSLMKAMKESPPSMETHISNRASQLLQNLAIVSPTVQLQLKCFDPAKARNSLKKRQSQIIDNDGNCFELDAETVRELDDIIAQLESVQKQTI